MALVPTSRDGQVSELVLPARPEARAGKNTYGKASFLLYRFLWTNKENDNVYFYDATGVKSRYKGNIPIFINKVSNE